MENSLVLVIGILVVLGFVIFVFHLVKDLFLLRPVESKPSTVGALLMQARYKVSAGAQGKLKSAVDFRKLPDDTRLTFKVLEEIRLALYDVGDTGEFAFYDILASRSGNPVDEALVYIQRLQEM